MENSKELIFLIPTTGKSKEEILKEVLKAFRNKDIDILSDSDDKEI